MLTDQSLKPITEAKYMASANAWRYRTILRFFYTQHEKLRHFLQPTEIYDYLKTVPHFQDYTEEQLEQDLNQLVEWNNLIPRQETGKVNTIEDFKRKKFRYQCTSYTIEFERLIQQLEQLGDSFGGSLERTLFDRLLDALLKLTSYQTYALDHEKITRYHRNQLSHEELYALWEDMYDYFRKLTENATDYLAYLKSEKVEEAMMTDSFLAFKDVLTQYLRDFMSALQRSSFRIEAILEQTSTDWLQNVVARLVDYQLSIPRLEEQPARPELEQRFLDQWSSLCRWFLGRDGRESELIFLQNETNETIRRITRYAQRIGERQHNFRSRRKDYLHLASWFNRIDDLQQAHKLSAAVFGMAHTRHLYAEEKMTEDIELEVWEHAPTILTIKPRIRQYREKTKPGSVENLQPRKAEMLRQYLKEKEAEQALINELIRNDRILLGELGEVEPYVRKTLLNWIGKCLGNKDQTTKIESGRRVRLLKVDERMIELHAEDGTLRMPHYALVFLDQPDGKE